MRLSHKGNCVLSWILRLGLAAVFVFAGVMKMRDPARFALEIGNYQMWPEAAAYVAVFLPALEIVAGAGLVFLPRAWRQASALVVSGMMVAFLVAVSSALARNVNIDCGCFGGGEGPISGLTVVRNAVLLASALCLAYLERNKTTAPAAS